MRSLAPDLLGEVDLVDTALHAEVDLSQVWARLREQDGLHLHRAVDGRPPFWLVTRHADVLAVLRDGATFSSQRGNVLDTLLRGGDSAAGQMLVISDAPRHSQLSAALKASFAPAALVPVVAAVREEARRLLAVALDEGQCDFARDVSANLPLTAICEMMDIPRVDRKHLSELTAASLSSELGPQNEISTFEAKNEILVYFSELASTRRNLGGDTDDLVTRLVTADIGGSQMPLGEVIYNCFSLLVAGVETTRLALNGAVVAFVEHPEQWRRFVDREVDTSKVVDEVLRWTSPALHAARTATKDTQVGGQPIAAGSVVSVWFSSANRDPSAFPSPDTFDLSRRPNRQIAFSFGPHFCLGAHLARLEMEAVLHELRDTVGQLRLTGAPRRVYSNFLQGFHQVPVAVSRR